MTGTRPTNVWIIMYAYYDHSNFGVINRAFADETEAQWQLALLQEQDTNRMYSVRELEVKQ